MVVYFVCVCVNRRKWYCERCAVSAVRLRSHDQRCHVVCWWRIFCCL